MIDKDTFVERYGGIFEHSPFVAERGYQRLALNQALTVSTIHLALCQAFRAASTQERLDVLKAHPDLAGKLAISGGLTEASKSEQAGAGLDRLSPAEHARFTELNDRYQREFGFPFIIAGVSRTPSLTSSRLPAMRWRRSRCSGSNPCIRRVE